MRYQKKYINFINGRYASEGLRVTAGILVPSLILHYFNMLPVGIVLSVGALCVSVADTPGAVRYRLTGMLSCSLLVAAISVLVYYTSPYTILLGCLLVVCGFLLSMLTVYGNRSSSVGIAALLIMILSLQTPVQGKDIWINAGYTFAGGIWYMCYSLVLYRLRPYKFIQQVLADYIAGIGTYLKLRGSLYALKPDYDKVNTQLLQQQIHVEAQQHMLSDLLFNTRAIVKESTQTGRVLVKIYLEVAELYESVMTTYQEYKIIHEQFDKTGILERFHKTINGLALEIEEVSNAIKTGISSVPVDESGELISTARKEFDDLRLDFMNGQNVENFVSLGRIMKNLEDLASKIKLLHSYTSYEVNFKSNNIKTTIEHQILPSTDLRPSLFFNNLNFKSNIFRHALRVALALLVGYIVAEFFKIDHGYWILLTIVVILKPAYSLTKKRNSDRLVGTLVGIVIGMLLLFFIKNNTALLIIMVGFMTASYMFMRTNYFLNVLLMTPYLIIIFHFLYPGNITDLMLDRVIDTAIGSAIAFFASLFLVPSWERYNIRAFMIEMLQANEKYYEYVARHFVSDAEINSEQIKIARRAVLIVLANLTDAFTRMLSEPKRHRQGVKNVHRFVVLNHTIISHLATLSYFLQITKVQFRSTDILPLIQNTEHYFQNTARLLSMLQEKIEPLEPGQAELIYEKLSSLIEKRKYELLNGQLETPTKRQLIETKSVIDQFNFILSDVSAIHKICVEYQDDM